MSTADAAGNEPAPPPEALDDDDALEALADSLFEAEARGAAETPLRRPTGTYRLQLHGGFNLADADAAVDYLADLGVSDVYLSPYLAAKAGSTHGYDVIDHGRMNPEVGDEAAHSKFLARLKSRGMGRVLDVVPNHMGFTTENPFTKDVLENGPQARWAEFFDVDWSPIKGSLGGRILLPVLEDVYGRVLEAGLIGLAREGGSFEVAYHDRRFPLRPRSYATVLGQRPAEFAARFDDDDHDVLEYLSVRDAAERLPKARFCQPDEVERLRREKEVIKRRLAALCETSPRMRAFVDDNVASFRGVEGDARSFDRLHELLEEQVYRLAYWRVATEEINYRRFFDVTDLAGIRVEDPLVFEYAHKKVFQWVAEGGVTGLRVDHPDGLSDPLGYFRRLQTRLFEIACRQRLGAEGRAGVDWDRLAPLLRRRFAAVVEAEPSSPLARRFPVVAEKILSTGEKLPADWPIDGTVGYEYLNALNGLFVNPEASELVDATYREFTGDPQPAAEVLHDSKVLVETALLASEVNALTTLLGRVAESSRRSRDFTLEDLRRVLVEVIACFRVYRTYQRRGDEISPRDREYVEQAVARARRRLPTVDRVVTDFVRDVLVLDTPPDIDPEARDLWQRFVGRFQQTTGPVQAKGLEDTTFYRQVPLVSLNEVGGDPARFASSTAGFHALNAHRLGDWPGGLSTTATHDTKRGEDGRIRIDAISELAEEWKTRLARWARWNARKKTVVNETECPDAREEYLLYQTLLGTWPMGGPEDAVPEGLVERVQGYVVKAASEAKRNTTWTDPDTSWKDALTKYVADILEYDDARPFLNDFLAFQRRVSRVGVVHSLAQTLLKMASPGVADVYQGCELWDFSMVDPDNRRPVDYKAREGLLAAIRSELDAGRARAEVAGSRLARPDDGAIKLFLVWTALNHRRENPDLYYRGAYRPVEPAGSQKDHVVGFARTYQGRSVLAVVPRLVAGLMGEDGSRMPVGVDVWGDTEVLVPEAAPGRWRDLLTDRVVEVATTPDHRALRVAELFTVLPVALLVDEPS